VAGFRGAGRHEDTIINQAPAPQAGRNEEQTMNAILRQLQILADSDLFALCDAVDAELVRRNDVTCEVPDSARRRANERDQGYRRRSGSGAPPVRSVGLGRLYNGRRAA